VELEWESLDDSGLQIQPVAEQAALIVTLNADAVVLVTAEDINETVFLFHKEADVSATGPTENGDAADNRLRNFLAPLQPITRRSGIAAFYADFFDTPIYKCRTPEGFIILFLRGADVARTLQVLHDPRVVGGAGEFLYPDLATSNRHPGRLIRFAPLNHRPEPSHRGPPFQRAFRDMHPTLVGREVIPGYHVVELK